MLSGCGNQGHPTAGAVVLKQQQSPAESYLPGGCWASGEKKGDPGVTGPQAEIDSWTKAGGRRQEGEGRKAKASHPLEERERVVNSPCRLAEPAKLPDSE